MKILIFMTVASLALAARASEAQTTEGAPPSDSVATSSATVASPPETAVEEQTPADAPKETVAPAPAETTPAETTPAASKEEKPSEKEKTIISGERLPPTTGRPYYLRGSVQFRMLAISDEDPANGRAMLYGLELGYRVDPQLTLRLRTGILQRFVVPSSDTSGLGQFADLAGEQVKGINTSPFLLRDSVAGAQYRQSVNIAEKEVSLVHYANLYFPTSLSSQDKGLYFVPELASRARIDVFDRFSVGIDLGLQYRFFAYDAQAGRNGAANTQWQVATGLAADYTIFDMGAEWGSLDSGIGVNWAWQNTYSLGGSDFWRQDYGWDVYLAYTPRAWLSFSVALEQGAPVLREGRPNPVLFHRDETELSFGVSATY